jgi:hypothetical protein
MNIRDRLPLVLKRRPELPGEHANATDKMMREVWNAMVDLVVANIVIADEAGKCAASIIFGSEAEQTETILVNMSRQINGSFAVSGFRCILSLGTMRDAYSKDVYMQTLSISWKK